MVKSGASPRSFTYQVSHNSLYTFNNRHSSLRWNPGAGWYLDSGLRQNDIFYLNSITHAPLGHQQWCQFPDVFGFFYILHCVLQRRNTAFV
ncbi:MAG: hypothetical protein HW402_1459 [Dehalococcoidales bacterium]|nr:hypothetical protein [Dehalococcoidales bacterium]